MQDTIGAHAARGACCNGNTFNEKVATLDKVFAIIRDGALFSQQPPLDGLFDVLGCASGETVRMPCRGFLPSDQGPAPTEMPKTPAK